MSFCGQLAHLPGVFALNSMFNCARIWPSDVGRETWYFLGYCHSNLGIFRCLKSKSRNLQGSPRRCQMRIPIISTIRVPPPPFLMGPYLNFAL